jgi:hypothetical protein
MPVRRVHGVQSVSWKTSGGRDALAQCLPGMHLTPQTRSRMLRPHWRQSCWLACRSQGISQHMVS